MKELNKLIMLYDKLSLECDGMTRVLSYVLSEMEIGHVVCTGILTGQRGSIPHFWIELENGHYIDLRAQMWQGKEDNIPHGIFNPKDYSGVTYEISTREQWEVSDIVYQILTGMQELLSVD